MSRTGPHAVWWTGREATALRRAMCLTAERFASQAEVSARTVHSWAANPDMVPQVSVQARLDALLTDAPRHVRHRFHALTGRATEETGDLAAILDELSDLARRLTRLVEAQ